MNLRAELHLRGGLAVHDRIGDRVPGDDLPSLRGEDEQRGTLARLGLEHEAAGRVEHLAGRVGVCGRQGDHQGHLRGGGAARGHAVQGGHAGAVVGHPQRSGRAEGQAPGVHQVGVDYLRPDGREVGDQVGLPELVRRPVAMGPRGGAGATVATARAAGTARASTPTADVRSRMNLDDMDNSSRSLEVVIRRPCLIQVLRTPRIPLRAPDGTCAETADTLKHGRRARTAQRASGK